MANLVCCSTWQLAEVMKLVLALLPELVLLLLLVVLELLNPGPAGVPAAHVSLQPQHVALAPLAV
jgi:hypothetical protein